ncbi:MAG: flagellar hook capping FlgD N-terminal domain-containing protein [Ilumatobacteraceae bacterium]
MATPVTSATSATAAATGSSADIFGGMGPDMFLKLLVAQLQYQNPMNPSDPSAMLGQVATYAQVEALNKLQVLQSQGNALSEVSQATDLIGSEVTAQGPAGEVSGTVTAARFTDAGPILVLDSGAEVSLSSIASIGGSSAAPAATSGTSTGSSGTTGSTGETAATSTTGTTATRSTSSAADSTATPDTATPDSATTDNPTTDNTTPDTSTSAPTDTSDETATPATSQASQMLAGAMARSNAADAA